MLQAGVKEAARNFAALVVGNDAPNFSAGANLMLVLLEAQEGNWDEIDLMVRAFQQATMALRYADVPVVVAPAGLTLGGGCEIALHGDRIAGGRGKLHRPRRGGRRPDSGRRRHQGDARAKRRRAAGRQCGPAALRPAGIRNDRVREGVDQRARRPPSRLPRRCRRRDDEPRAVDERCEGAGARAGARADISARRRGRSRLAATACSRR